MSLQADSRHVELSAVLPSDPFMLLSAVNTRLRDNYTNLDELCDDLDIDKSELIEKLKETGFDYLPEINQFR